MPNLRTAFLRHNLRTMYASNQNVVKLMSLIKGEVVDTNQVDDDKFRKVTMVLMVDLCKAKEFYDKCQECKKQGSKSGDCKECK